jgi:flagellar basal body-associated protein FliL
MEQNAGTPPEETPKKTNSGLIIAIIVVVVLCCCCIAGLAAIYFGYDALGDPLGIYSSIPAFGAVL